MEPVQAYIPKNKIRLVTAASLFDGHDVSINIMRRILQASGAEVIHLGHNRSAGEIVACAIQEDVQGIAITSYQGGHNEFFRYVLELLREKGASHIRVFGGGGGVILPGEIAALEEYGVSKIYSPDDGRRMGLQGMINHLLEECDFPVPGLNGDTVTSALTVNDHLELARAITCAEAQSGKGRAFNFENAPSAKTPQNGHVVLGITGTGGAGKSSLTDELVRRFLHFNPALDLAIISIDPSKKKSGGALLGDRIRMNSIYDSRVYMRSLATRGVHQSLSGAIREAVSLCANAGFKLVIVETSGIGQSDSDISTVSNVSLYVMTPEFGAASQLEKIDMLDFADLIAINKSDKKGAQDALRDVRRQYQRNQGLFDTDPSNLPVFSTIASQFNDPGTNRLFYALSKALSAKTSEVAIAVLRTAAVSEEVKYVIRPSRVRYLAEIREASDRYEEWVEDQCSKASSLFALEEVTRLHLSSDTLNELTELKGKYRLKLDQRCFDLLQNWPAVKEKYAQDYFSYEVRGNIIRQPLKTISLSGISVPKVSLPGYTAWGDLLKWLLRENLPGEFPYTAGVFPLKREGEDPTRMFAGEGSPERTNKRFHYVSVGQPAKRLSTAFDSVTLYGEDPHERPDIYGKIGNAGVSIATVDDAKKLYSGFDLCSPGTSVSMTINGPAPIILAFFLNAAIDQQCEIYLKGNSLNETISNFNAALYRPGSLQEPTYAGDLPQGNDGLGLTLLGISGDTVLDAPTYRTLKAQALHNVRGTVQADILKEDQAQNTCIFSTEFALKMMGDIQEYFNEEKIRNFYSVSISGYHIAEAGANPISQLAFTLSNGFTYVEYYLSRGLKIDDFAPNLSFFFSNGIDPEYAVIGRVARRIWAKAILNVYGGNERSQKLKYHIQTSGRSLHAQEIDFNDIRTTLQALYAVYDNCNSLHTNAYDEAITTPTEESVRRAMAIQLIINRELGLAKNENPSQGSFIIEELTNLVEEAVMLEFQRISDRGGVLGAMETMYQRGKIQEESLYYETRKHDGSYPIIGVNTFLNSSGSPTLVKGEVIRATEEEKQRQIFNLNLFKERNSEVSDAALQDLKETALRGDNIFRSLMEVTKVCSLGQITHALYEVGGQYRRNM